MIRTVRRLLVVLLAGLGLALPQVAVGDSPPPGATARCKDGTYSFSQTRQGTCSHHGGVAEWLTGSTTPPATTTMPTPAATTTAATTTTATTTPVPTAPAATTPAPKPGPKPTKTLPASTVDVGKTVLLRKRTKTSGCKLGANPDRRCSPGAYYSGLTRSVLCAPSFRTSQIRDVSEKTKYAVEREYGLVPKHYGRTLEIDHIISLELGGSNDIANLYPELADADPGYKTKDKLENKVADMVCDGQISLRAAQSAIAADWQALYKQVYGTAPQG